MILLLSKNLLGELRQTSAKSDYHTRYQQVQHPIVQKLFSIAVHKKSNLILAADVYTQKELLQLIDEVGPHICMLKLHIDCIEDFDNELPKKLQHKAQEYQFLLCEDRKFADIGSTARMQMIGGIYQIVSWADIIIAHAIAGPGIIDAVRSLQNSHSCGMLLIAELSCKGNLIDATYTNNVINMMQENKDIVIGVIGQKCSIGDQFIKATPGVHMELSGDSLGQQYNTPEVAIENGADFIIVGRGIYHAKDRKEASRRYQQAGWETYQKFVGLPR